MSIENSTYNIETIDDLLGMALKGIPDGITKLTISPEISTIHIRVCGDGYGAAIPGEQLRTLWELQENIYRLAAFAMNGSTDIRSLGETRQQFEVKVSVENGSWKTDITTSDFWSALFENTLGHMSGTEISFTICLCVLMCTGYLAWDSKNKRIEAVEKEKTARNASDNMVAMAQGQNETVQKQSADMLAVVESFNHTRTPVTEKCVEHTSSTLNNTAEKLSKRGSGITSMEVAGKSYGSDEIEALRTRSRNEPDHPDNLSGEFRIHAVDKGSLPWTVKLSNVFDGSETIAKLAPDAIDGDGEQAKRDILHAFSEDLSVTCEIAIGRKRNLITSIVLSSDQEESDSPS